MMPRPHHGRLFYRSRRRSATAGRRGRSGWITRREGTRIVTVTPAGAAGLRDWLGVDVDRLRADAA